MRANESGEGEEGKHNKGTDQMGSVSLELCSPTGNKTQLIVAYTHWCPFFSRKRRIQRSQFKD